MSGDKAEAGQGLRRTVRVALGERSYDVVIGPDLLGDLADLAIERFGETRFAIVTDEHVAQPDGVI